MGSSTSQPAKNLDERTYLLPEDRAKERFIPRENEAQSALFDPSVDKYDLLIVFPLTTETSGKKTTVINTLGGILNQNVSAWTRQEFRKVWEKASPGSQVDKAESYKAFVEYWKRRTDTDFERQQTLDDQQLKTIVRDAIVENLAAKGLQLKLTASKKYIFCRIRAPIRLLEVQADIDNYPLQLKGEIDPGSDEFWNQTMHDKAPEIIEEQKLLSLEEAKSILEKLYRAGKISAGDMIINTKDETKEAWSLRVHALERIADRVPLYNKFPAYGTLISGKPFLRYIFQTYPSVRGMTLFKSKDRLSLTKSIVETCFDVEILIERKLIVDFTALHDANRGEALNISSLARRWMYFWLVSSSEVGSPMVSHPAYEVNAQVAFYERPFCQPLSDIRDYFGEKVGLYYAWLGHFTFYLIVPALLATAMEVYYFYRGEQILLSGLDWPTYSYGLVILTWATLYIQSWRRECSTIAVKWGTRGFENEEKPRPQFDGIIKRSEVTSELEVFFPEEVRHAKATISWSLISLATMGSMLMIFGAYYFEYIAVEYVPSLSESFWMTFLVSVVAALIIQLNALWYLQMAFRLNNYENYRTETDYEDHLVSKLIFFELLNTFGTAAFVAYGKGWLFDTCYENCFVDLRTFLYAVMLVRIVKSSTEMIVAILEKPIREFVRLVYIFTIGACIRGIEKCLYGRASFTFDPLNEDEAAGLLAEGNEEDRIFTKEIDMKPVPSTFVESSGVFFQFAFVNLFSLAVPVLAIASLLENVVKIRVDAFKMCYRCRRPHADRAEDAGYWFEMMEYMVYGGIYVNTAFVLFAFPDMANYSYAYRMILFLALTQFLVLYVMWIRWLLPEEPEELMQIVQRQEFIVTKYIKGFQDLNQGTEERSIFADVDDDPSAAGAAAAPAETVIDIDSLQLHDLRKGRKLEDRELEDMEKLELRRREVTQKIKSAQDRLQELYKTEVFNDVLGVGETKQGLALGRLTVRLDTVINVHIPAAQFKVRVRLVPDERNERGVKIAPMSTLPSSMTDTRWSAFTVVPDVDGLEGDPHHADIEKASKLDPTARHYVPTTMDGEGNSRTGGGGGGGGGGGEEKVTFSPLGGKKRTAVAPPPPHATLDATRKNKSFLKSFIYHIDDEDVDPSLASKTISPYEPLTIGPFAPIKTIHANIVFELFAKFPSHAVNQYPADNVPLFTAIMALKKLADQTPRQEKILLKPTQKALDAFGPQERVELSMNLLFQYSKIIPVRNKMMQSQHQLQLIEEALTAVLGGKVPTTTATTATAAAAIPL